MTDNGHRSSANADRPDPPKADGITGPDEFGMVAPVRARPGSFADVVERLMGEFDSVHQLSVIVAVVRGAQADLDLSDSDVPDRRLDTDTAVELVERLARARLLDLPRGLRG